MRRNRVAFCTLLTFVGCEILTANVFAQKEHRILAEADAMVAAGGNVMTSFGEEDNLTIEVKNTAIGKDIRDSDVKKAFLRFDLSDIPEDLNIQDVKLRLYVKHANGEALAARYFLNWVDNNTWSENSTTWDNAPIGESRLIANRRGAETGQYVDFNLTYWARRGKELGPFSKDKITFLLQEIVTTQTKALVKFASKENPNDLFRPTLIYTERPEAKETFTVYPEADAMVVSGRKAGVNFGKADKLNAKGVEGSDIIKKSFLKFDITDIPRNLKLNSVKLRLYVKEASADAIANEYTLHSVGDRSWLENQITWNNSPTVKGVILNTFDGANENEYIEIDLLGLREHWFHDRYRFFKDDETGRLILSLAIQELLTSNGNTGALKFASKEDLNELFRPAVIFSGELSPFNDETLIIPAEADAMVVSGAKANIAFGTLDKLNVKINEKNGVIKKSYLKFNLSSIDNPEDVETATLRLFVKEASPNAVNKLYPIYYCPHENWSEDGLGAMRWITAPGAFRNMVMASLKGANPGEFVDVDLTEWVRWKVEHRSPGQTRLSFVIEPSVIRDADGNVILGSDNDKIIFASRENPNELLRPRLIVEEKRVGERPSNTNTNADANAATAEINSPIESLRSEVLLYPNPAKNHINFSMKNISTDGEVQLNVVSIDGKLIYNEHYLVSKKSELNTSIPLEDIKQGVYILNVSINNQLHGNYRFVKQ